MLSWNKTSTQEAQKKNSFCFAKACAPGLFERLQAPVVTSSTLGPVSNYMRERYDFTDDCTVVAFTGDNPVRASFGSWLNFMSH